MGIVRESISFTRGKSERDIKASLFGFRPGQMIASSRELSNQEEMFGYKNSHIYVIERESKDSDLFSSRYNNKRYLVHGFGKIYSYKNKESSFKETIGIHHMSLRSNEMRPLTNEEKNIIEKWIFSDESHRNYLHVREFDINQDTPKGKMIKIFIG